MKRKAAWSGFSFLAGTMLYCLWSSSERILLLVSGIVVIAGIQVFRRYWVLTCVVSLMFLAGLLNAMAFTHFRIYPQYGLEGKEYCISGTIKQCKYFGSDRWQTVIDGKTKEGVRCKLLFYSDKPIDEQNSAEVSAVPELIKDNAGFSAASYYNQKGIYLQSSSVTEIKDNGPGRNYLLRLSIRLRDRVSESICSVCDDETAGFLQALVCGDKSELSDISKEVLYRTGLGHIFAVSGLHITVVALLFSTIFSTLKFPRHTSSVLTCFVILLFMAFAGFSAPVTRAGIMHIFVFTGSLFGRRTDCLNSLGLCALIMAAIDPYCVITVSFIMSFASAAAIGAAAPKLTTRLSGGFLKPAKASVIISFTIMAATMPQQIFFFKIISVAAPITNLLLAPLCTAALALLPLSMLLGGTTAPARLMIGLSGALVRFAVNCCKKLAAVRFTTISGYHRIILFLMAVALVWVLISALVKKSPGYLAFGSTIVLVFAASFSVIASQTGQSRLRLFVIHSGYKTTAVIIERDTAAVIDIGSNGTHCRTVQELFSYYGVQHFDGAFIYGDSGTNIYSTNILPECSEIFYEEGFAEDISQFDGLDICSTGSGYELSVFGAKIELSKKLAVVDGNTIDLTKQNSIIEIDIHDSGCEIMTLDNRFNSSRAEKLTKGG